MPRGVKPEKKKRDPNAPKKPMSAWLFFCQENRALVTAENPEAKAPDILKLLGVKKKTINAKEAKKYDDMAVAARKAYDEKMANYVVPDEFKNQKQKKDPNMPKRALSAWLYYCAAHRATVKVDNPDAKAPDILKLLAAKKKLATEKELEQYQALADKDKERYQKEMAIYKVNHPKKKTAKPAARDDNSSDDSD
eukprot:TRINITY_DN8738_c0_g1_i1.p1 TRINITY_DN8738_c0_g1~~TRINITY_DN8738_c0_g1_i1.p1  ORF type:complete len:194 (+),score=71.51 TRINITY_DN8738_c0_g1_i1:80-661(+)